MEGSEGDRLAWRMPSRCSSSAYLELVSAYCATETVSNIDGVDVYDMVCMTTLGTSQAMYQYDSRCCVGNMYRQAR